MIFNILLIFCVTRHLCCQENLVIDRIYDFLKKLIFKIARLVEK